MLLLRMSIYRIGVFDADHQHVLEEISKEWNGNAEYSIVDDRTLELLLPEDIDTESLITALSKSSSWDGTILDLNDLPEIEELVDDEVAVETEEQLQDIQDLEEFLGVDAGEGPKDLPVISRVPPEFMDMVQKNIDILATQYSVDRLVMLEVGLSVVSWFLPFTDHPTQLIANLTEINRYIQQLLNSRLRHQVLEDLVQYLESKRQEDTTGCVESVINLINTNWNTIIEGESE